MSVFGNMMSKIFGRAGASSGSSAAGSTTVAAGTGPAQASETQASPGASGGGVQSEVKQNVDVAAVLDGLASKNQQRLDWKHSIVDMMKLLDMDFEPFRTQRTRERTTLFGRHKRLRVDEHMAAQTSDAEARREWRESAG